MYLAGFELASFESLPLDEQRHCIYYLLEGLAGIDRLYLARNPRTPALYDFGPRYVVKERPFVQFRKESMMSVIPFKIDRWQDIPRTMQLRQGDCKDFAAWRVAELRQQGHPDVGFYVKPIRMNDLQIFHILVRKGILLEDPSDLLGMPHSVPYEVLKQ